MPDRAAEAGVLDPPFIPVENPYCPVSVLLFRVNDAATSTATLQVEVSSLASVLDPPFGLSLGGWNVWQKLQDNIMLNNKLSQLSRG